MSEPTIAQETLAKLSGYTVEQLRQLAKDGHLPRSEKGQYPFAAALARLFAHLRALAEKRDILDVYDSIAQCAAATGIPVAVMREAKRTGCPAFKSNRVYTLDLIKYLFGQNAESENTNWSQVKAMWQARREESRYLREKETLVDKHEADSTFAAVVAKAVETLRQSVENELPATMCGLDPAAGRIVAKRTVDRILRDLQSFAAAPA